MASSEPHIIQSRRAVIMSGVRSFLHAAALGAIVVALFGAGRPASFVVGGLLGVLAASRSKRVGVAFNNGQVLVSNYFRTIVFPNPAEVRVHEYGLNRMDLEKADGSRTSVQSAMWWSEHQREQFFSLASTYGMKTAPDA